MDSTIISSIIISILTALLTLCGTFLIQEHKSKSTIKKNALYMYLNLKQVKHDIDRDKRLYDNIENVVISFSLYFSPFDYISVLCELKVKLVDEEIQTVNDFYERVKKLDSFKMTFQNYYSLYINNIPGNPAFTNPYEGQYRNAENNFKQELNKLTNSIEYKEKLVNIISKLKSMK